MTATNLQQAQLRAARPLPPPPAALGDQVFFTRAEAAAILRMGVRTLDRLIAAGRIPAAKRADGRRGRVLVARHDLLAAIEMRRRGEI